jgi:hypothetical protein
MPLKHTGPLVTGEVSTKAKVKTATSPPLDMSTAADYKAIMYTSTAITITAVKAYITETVTNNAQTVDVGVNGALTGIVSDQSVADKVKDTVNALTIASGSVAADKVVVASVHTSNASAGMCAIEIEYTEAA